MSSLEAPNVHDAEPIPEAARAEIDRLLQSGDLFRYTAPEDAPVALLEAEFAEMMGMRYALAVASCSAALFLALKALELPRDARVLILDEATSNLDLNSESRVERALDVLLDGRTAVIIAHRLSTIASMDRIVVLDRGRIVEEGTAEELRLRGGLFSRLWALQRNGLIGDELSEVPAA